MKILEINSETYRVFGDSLVIKEKLKPAVYTVVFVPMQGFFLKKHTPLTVTEKLYGKHEQKINKLLKAYEHFERPMGVIFSGDKGIGKSIAARMLCQKSVEKGLPVILVEENFEGLTQFLNSIEQECVVLFDEFEKNFKKVYDRDGDEKGNAQDSLLSLFDGTGNNIKRLYLITCNDTYQLSDFMVNRPGRFHYHIRWEYPTQGEITEYLKDKVKPEYHDQIEEVLKFTAFQELNYDCLRAIAFELNMGQKFVETLEDLNIKNDNDERYDLVVQFKNGGEASSHGDRIDLFSDRKELYIEGGKISGYLEFSPRKAKVSSNGVFELDLKTTKLQQDRSSREDTEGEDMSIIRAYLKRNKIRDTYSYKFYNAIA